MPYLVLFTPFLLAGLVIGFGWAFSPARFNFSRRFMVLGPFLALAGMGFLDWLPEANNDPLNFQFSLLGRIFLVFLFSLSGLALVAAYTLKLMNSGRLSPVTLLVCGAIQAGLYFSNPFLVTLSFVAANFFSIVAIVDLTGDREERFVKAVRSAVRYLIASVLFGLMLFVALVFLERLRLDPQASGVIKVAVALLVVGFCLRLGIFPFNLWLPELLEEAQGLGTFLVIGLINVGATVFLIEFLQKNPALLFDNYEQARPVMALGLAAAMVAALLALCQNALGKMLAYIISSQYGLILFGLASPHTTGKSGALFDLANLALLQLLIFTSLGVLYYCNQEGTLEGLAGLGRRVPVAATGLAVGFLGMAGAPFLSGFVGKYLIIQSAAQEGLAWALGVGLAVAICLVALLAYFHRLFMGTETPGLKLLPEPRSTSLLIVGLIGAVILLGLFPGLGLGWITNALNETFQ